MSENLGSQNMNVSTKLREGGCVVQGHGGFIPVPRFQPCWTGVGRADPALWGEAGKDVAYHPWSDQAFASWI